MAAQTQSLPIVNSNMLKTEFINSCNDVDLLREILMKMHKKPNKYSQLKQLAEARILFLTSSNTKNNDAQLSKDINGGTNKDANQQVQVSNSQINKIDSILNTIDETQSHTQQDLQLELKKIYLETLDLECSIEEKKIDQNTQEQLMNAEKQKADQCYDSQKYLQAFRFYSRALVFNRASGKLSCDCGNSLFQLGELKQAEVNYSNAIKNDPSLIEAWIQRGKIRFESENFIQAINDLNEAFKLNPNNQEIRRILNKIQKRYNDILNPKEKEIEHKSEYHHTNIKRLPIVVEQEEKTRQEKSDSELKQSILKLISEQNINAAIETIELQLGTLQHGSNAELQMFLQVQLLNCYAANKNHQKIISICTQILTTDKNSVTILLHRARAYYKLEDFVSAKSDIERVLEIDNTLEEPIELLDYCNQKIAQKTHTQQQENAKLSQDHKAKGNTYMSSNEFQEAIQEYTEAIKLDQTNIAAWNNRAAAYLKLQQYEQVIGDTSYVLSSEPQNVKALYRRGLAYRQTCHLQEASNDFLAILEIDVNNKDAQNQLETLQKEIEQKNNVETKQWNLQHQSKAMEIKENPVTQEDLTKNNQTEKFSLSKQEDTSNQVNQSQLQEEGKTLTREIEIDSELSRKLQFEGNELFKQGNIQGAIDKYTKALESNFENNEARNNRAMAFIKLKKFQDAFDDCNQILESEPGNLKGLYRRAVARRNIANDYSSLVLAKLDLETALNLFPTDKIIYSELQIIQKLLDNCTIATEIPPPKNANVELANYDQSKNDKSSDDKLLEDKPFENKHDEKINETKPSPENQSPISENKKPEYRKINHDIAHRKINVQVSVPTTPPKSLFQFEQTWKNLKSSESAQGSYLLLFTPKILTKIFNESMEPDLVEEIISVTETQLLALHPKQALKILSGLSKAPRFCVIKEMLSDQTKRKAKNIIDSTQSQDSTKLSQDWI